MKQHVFVYVMMLRFSHNYLQVFNLSQFANSRLITFIRLATRWTGARFILFCNDIAVRLLIGYDNHKHFTPVCVRGIFYEPHICIL